MSPNTASSASHDLSNEHLRLFRSNGPEEDSSDPIIQCVIKERSSGQEWQLTWPIWHSLPHVERKRIASDYGMSVGQFEEFASLQQAMEHSLPTGQPATHENRSTSSDNLSHYKSPKAALIKEDHDEGEDSDISPSLLHSSTLESNGKFCDHMILIHNESNRTKKLIKADTAQSSLFLTMIPEDLMHKILAFLTVDTYGVCRRVCSLLEQMATKEVSYKVRCERIYSNQTRSRGVMRMERWNYSYRNMWKNRPRVLTGGGLYVWKHSHVKPIQRDMWTEVPLGAVLETKYYRYLYFCENGTMFYALTPIGPNEIIPKLVLQLKNATPTQQHYQQSKRDSRIVQGTYEVCKNIVRIVAKYSWCHVALDMKIASSRKKKFSELHIIKHQTLARKINYTPDHRCFGIDDTHAYDIVEYDIPSEPFRFLLDTRL